MISRSGKSKIVDDILKHAAINFDLEVDKMLSDVGEKYRKLVEKELNGIGFKVVNSVVDYGAVRGFGVSDLVKWIWRVDYKYENVKDEENHDKVFSFYVFPNASGRKLYFGMGRRDKSGAGSSTTVVSLKKRVDKAIKSGELKPKER